MLADHHGCDLVGVDYVSVVGMGRCWVRENTVRSTEPLGQLVCLITSEAESTTDHWVQANAHGGLLVSEGHSM